MAEVFTNAALKKAIDTYGDRIKSITFDGNYTIMIGYPGAEVQHAKDLILETIGGIDMVGVRSHIRSYADAKRAGATFVAYHTTSTMFGMTIVDEGFEDYFPDPHGIK